MITNESICRRLLLLPSIDPKIKFIISNLVMEEIKGHKIEISRKAGIPIMLFMKGLKELLTYVDTVNLTRPDNKEKYLKFVKDVSDAHLVILAIESKADYIITYNKKDFHAKRLAPYGIKIRTPVEFLNELNYFWTDSFIKKKGRDNMLLRYSTKLKKVERPHP